ncbi:MAG TPA: nuclear transport factor 2 family protein [Acidimicrobiia bacterium]|nr:nuclear transport factor 2 family protein [Acidimicrobiia bacterium]
MALLDGITAQDFAGLQTALAPDVHLRALLPDGLREWTGADIVAARFERWFGHTEQFAVVERHAGEVGGRVTLRWRLRLQAERLGAGWFVVEQVAYCDANEREVTRLDLLCTGYLPEASDG